MPIRLTDSELDTVFAACRPLAVRDRDAFLQDVANALASCSDVGPGTVFRICRELQRRHCDYPLATEPGAPPPRRSVHDA